MRKPDQNLNQSKVKYRAKVITKRNDSHLNSHQRLQLQGWRANCDIQIIIDYHACVEYMGKYASKGEPKSPILKQTLKSVLEHNTNTTDTSKLIKKLMMKTLGERDFSAQETMHHLLSLKLYSSKFKVFNVCLNGSRRVKQINNEGNQLATENSILDVYANRQQFISDVPDIMNINFVDFVTKFKVVNQRLKEHGNANEIPRFFPTYSSNSKADSFPLYCKYQLLRYKPWKHAEYDACGIENPTDEVYVSRWDEFLQTEYAQNHVPDWYQKLQAIQNFSEEQSLNSELTDCPLQTDTVQREEWMILSDSHQPFSRSNTNQNVDNTEYWQKSREKYTPQQIGEMPQWINQHKNDINNVAINGAQFNINTFSSMQSKAYNIVKCHYEKIRESQSQLLLIVIGVGGTGKSFLINAIRNLIGNACTVTAPTGKAAYNIKGVTIHSLLKLPIGSKGRTDLTGQSLIRLQTSLADIKYIIIDEYSTLGQCSLGWIDKRCQQATGKKDENFGGLSLILIGDQGQLPPVGDRPLYHSTPTSEIAQQGHLLYLTFQKVVEGTCTQLSSTGFTTRTTSIQRTFNETENW